MATNAYQSSDIPIESASGSISLAEFSEHAVVEHPRPLIDNSPDAG